VDSTLLTALRDLNSRLDTPPGDRLWDDESLDTHSTWLTS
jgi:hypothetical protein